VKLGLPLWARPPLLRCGDAASEMMTPPLNGRRLWSQTNSCGRGADLVFVRRARIVENWMRTLRALLCLPLMLCLLALGGCAPAISTPGTLLVEPFLTPIASLRPASLGEGERLRVVATTNIVADVVAHVGGDAIELATLLPVGIDPHTYEPSPQDLTAIVRAHVILINGLGLEAFLATTLQDAGSSAAVVSLSEGIQPLSREGQGGGVDPHVWLDPNNVAIWVDNAARALAALDPARAENYQANADGYRRSLEELDRWISSQVSLIPASARKLVADHDELGYFAARYGFEVVGAVVPAYSTSAEASAQEISRLEAAIRSQGVRCIFVRTGVNVALAQQVARDTGVPLVPLYTHSLSGPEGPAASYLRLMEYNVNAIVSALK